MTRPTLLDLFCGAGGAGMGYHRAGYDVHGWDNRPHPDYPFSITVGDAMDALADHDYLSQFDVVHASPPCPRYSAASSANVGTRETYPDLVPPVQAALAEWGGTYVIENVPGAPLDHPLLLCGWAMGLLHIRRHRLFESNRFLMSPGCLCPTGDSVSVFGDAGEDRRKQTLAARGPGCHRIPLDQARALMGVEWMKTRKAVSNAIPPAYTEFIGHQLLGT